MRSLKPLGTLKKTFQRGAALCVCAALLFTGIARTSSAGALYKPDNSITINSKSVYLYNLDTETAVYEKAAQDPLQPASTAKIMTCILALENTDDLDEEWTYPTYIFDMLYPGVSQADVRVGEVMTMRKALYCLMLQSDCYSALAIADRIGGGDIQTFVDMMNERSKELGAINTYFTNPHGLVDAGDEDMHTTAYDLCQITRHAMRLDGFMEIVSKTTVDISPTNMHEKDYNLFTTIYPMVKSSPYYYAPIRGIKTGTLDGSYNYVSTATKDGYSYILVLLGAPMYADQVVGTPADSAASASGSSSPSASSDAPDPAASSSSAQEAAGGTGEEGTARVKLKENLAFVDAKNIYQWAFDYFETKVLFEKGKVANEIPVRLSSDAESVKLVAANDFSALVPAALDLDAEDGTGIIHDWILPESIDAPVKRGDSVGSVRMLLGGVVIGEVQLLAEKDVSRSQMLYMMDNLKGVFSSFLVKFIVVLVLLIIVFYIVLLVLRNRYRKRYRRARGRRR